jgi:hypothetical protein
MNDDAEAYALPEHLSGAFARVRDAWSRLRRGGAEMPFWDDLKLSALGDDADWSLLIDVFEHPWRFRFNFIGGSVAARFGERPLAGIFMDKIEPSELLDHLQAQCAATVERRAATFRRHVAESPEHSYERMLLPLWGNGRIDMMLGVMVPLAA